MTKVTHLTLDERGELSRRRAQLRDISGGPDTPLETVGRDLRTARLRRGDDISAVSRALRIRKDHLEAIEEDRFEALPGRTYAVGFVRTYSGYLGLDAQLCVERFKEETADRPDGSPQVSLSPEYGTSGLPSGWLIMAFVVIAVAAYGTYQLVRSADRLSVPPVAPVPARIATIGEITGHGAIQHQHAPGAVRAPHLPSLPMKAMAGTSSAVTPGKTGGAIATTGTKGAGGVSVSSLPPLASTAAPPARGTVGADNLAAKAVQAPAPAAGQVLGAKAARVLLHVRGLTRVLVEGADGTVYINRILHPGDTYRVPDMMGLSLTTPDGGAVGLELDGHDLGVAGHSGEMTEALPLDPQALVDRSGSRNPG